MIESKKIRKNISISELIENYLEIDRFLLCCKECPNYGKKHTCPPHDFDVLNFWREFSDLEVHAVILPGNQNYEQAESSLMDELLSLEKECPGSVCLSAGNAGVSQKERMRYSIESLGGNVDKLCRELLGVSLEWGKDGMLPDQITLVAGLLKK